MHMATHATGGTTSSGVWMTSNVKTGGGSKCLVVNAMFGLTVVVNSCSDSGYQKWTYDPASLSFKRPSLGLSQCLDYDDKGSYTKAKVYMHACLGQKTNQEWTWTLV
ncbi:unnamed protein product [Polarella glacialis]|uniref:Ricin B lectin domain-containing protein n=1 Tax=Polarella glacialis TaxID=89957 RepID=A0A813GVV5_POLGL|nr:unnamed protein product [Polarella glacialis]